MYRKNATLQSPSGVELKRIAVPFALKAEAVNASDRTFEGLLSVWGEDLGGDHMHRGAFTETLKEWKASHDALPLLNGHNHFDIMAAVGQLLEAEETTDGLWTKWEVIDGPDGDAALARLRPSARTKRAPISKMSIGYEAVEFDFEKKEGSPYGVIRHLRKVNLKEGSLVIFPMAPGARINSRSVKCLTADDVKSWNDYLLTVDPAALDEDTVMELRRQASRVGNLVTKATSPTIPAPQPPVTPPVVPSIPNPPAPEPAPAPTPVETPATPPATPATPPAPTPTPIEHPADTPAAPTTAADNGSADPIQPEAKDGLDPLLNEALTLRLQSVLNHPITKSLGV